MASTGDRTRLLSDLEELAELLEGVGEEGWAQRLTTARDAVQRGDEAGLNEVVVLIGRPGDDGLNDLVIHPSRGHDVDEDDLDELNQRIGLLSTTCYRLARSLQRRGGEES